MTKILPTLLFIFLSFSLLEAQQTQNGTCTCPNPFTVATFNTLQIFFSGHQDERLNGTVKFFSQPEQEDIDVLCLQELWDPVQRQAVISGLNSTYPYSYFAPKFSQNCNGGCTLEQITALRECFDRNNCFDLSLHTLRCFVDDCREEFANLDVECQSCFDLRSHDFDIERRFEECAAKQLSGNCTFLFDGWSDNLLLSKTPFLQTDFLLYTDSPLAQWTVLYAQVNTSTFSTPANIFCTHLSARLPIVDTSLANERQIRQLAQYIASKTNSSSPVFVMGDFNTGPRTDGLDATRPENFNTFINAGYNSVLLGLNQTICTYCGSENPLAKSTTSQDWMIDHIFVPSQSDICTVSGIRIADNNTYVTLNNGDTSPLSDHYGVKASFCEGNFNLSPHTFDAIQALNPSYAERIALPSLLFLLFWALLNVSF